MTKIRRTIHKLPNEVRICATAFSLLALTTLMMVTLYVIGAY